MLLDGGDPGRAVPVKGGTMTCESVNISPASRADLSDILALLKAVNLPHEGVEEHLGGFLVARDFEGRLAGTVGIERHG